MPRATLALLVQRVRLDHKARPATQEQRDRPARVEPPATPDQPDQLDQAGQQVAQVLQAPRVHPVRQEQRVQLDLLAWWESTHRPLITH